MTAIHDGIIVHFAGSDWVVPALSLGQLKKLIPHFQALQGGQFSIEQIDSSLQVIHAALSRNYPALQLEDVEDLVDLAIMPILMDAILWASGLVRSGEALAGHRWTLDTADDFEILTGLFARLPEGSQGWGYQAVLDKQV